MEDIFIVDSKKDLEEEVEKLFTYWRDKGFPNYNKKDYNKENEYNKLKKFDESNIFDNGYLKQTMHSCGFLWTYFPHWVQVRCGGETNSLLENWEDDNKLKTLIRKTYKWQLKHGNGKFTINRLRQNAKVYMNKQSVSNFRPTVAKYIYNNFAKDGVVWDMSCGWGGRLFGFLASESKKYIGTEPSLLTYEGLNKLKTDYNYINKEIELHKIGSEEFIPKPESLDLCFTSPPYFNTEKYSLEDSQSYIKFPTKEKWTEGFLRKTIKNCHVGLKHGKHMLINIANVKGYENLEEVTVKIAQQEGFYLEDTYKLILSSIAGKGIKTEPIFIFKKP